MKKLIIFVSILVVVLPIIYYGFGFHEGTYHYDHDEFHVNPDLYIILYLSLVLGVLAPMIGLKVQKHEEKRKRERKALKKKKKKEEKLALYAEKLDLYKAKLENGKHDQGIRLQEPTI